MYNMKITEANKAITKAFQELNEVDDARSLKKLGLTLAEYDTAKELFDRVSHYYIAETLIKAVAEFFKRCGLIVTESGCGYVISSIYPKYVPRDGYILCFSHTEGRWNLPIYRGRGGSSLVDQFEIDRGSNKREDLL